MERLLIIRDEKIGDFALAWPLYALLKQHFPNAELTALVNKTVAPLARVCPYIDDVMELELNTEILLKRIKEKHFCACLVHATNLRACFLVWKAEIKDRYRVGGRMYSLFFNHRIVLPKVYDMPVWKDCYQYLEALGVEGASASPIPHPVWDLSQKRARWREYYGADSRPLVMIHPGSGGSSNVYPIEMYVEVIRQVSNKISLDFKVLLSWSGQEKKHAKRLDRALSLLNVEVLNVNPFDSVAEYARSLCAIDVMIACSTGPLHLASLHNVYTIGLYAYRRNIRWQTLSAAENRVEITVPKALTRKKRRNIALIPPNSVANALCSAISQIAKGSEPLL